MSPPNDTVPLRAPAQNGQILCVPPIEQAKELLTSRCHRQTNPDTNSYGRWINHLAESARVELIEAAIRFTRTYCDPRTSAGDARELANHPIIMAGHQAGFVHPGVWLKNFTSSHLAHAAGGTAIHLIIDSDLCRNPSIRVPTGTAQAPGIQMVPFDQASEPIPMEERSWNDPSLWNTFGQRAGEAISPLIPDSMVVPWWQEVGSRSADAPSLGLGVARARHLTEIAWGIPGLEIPQSHVCQLPSFRRFLLHLLAELPRFHQAYNGALADYRSSHHLRNHAQPVPDLIEHDGVKKDGWLETPFWIWSIEDPRRRPLYARFSSNRLELTDRVHFHEPLPGAGDGTSEEAALECLIKWESRGVKLRTRALLTTMFARLVLADTFIHGIGGAKYDQVTDAISLRFFGLLPPPFMTLSGTLRLPTGAKSVDPDRSGPMAQQLRQLQYHPERHIDWMNVPPESRGAVQEMIDRKEASIQIPKTELNASARHQEIMRANTALQPWLDSQRKEIVKETIDYENNMRSSRILQFREYAYCLFPQDLLEHFLLDFPPSIV